MKIYLKIKPLLLLGLLTIFNGIFKCNSQSVVPPYQDKNHFRQTFGTDRNYRVYLPKRYGNDAKDYPDNHEMKFLAKYEAKDYLLIIRRFY